MKDIDDVKEKLLEALPRLKRYLPFLFVILVALTYGYLLYQTQTLSNRQPAANLVTPTASVPHIDPQTLSQLKSLQDNSVSVQALFDNARSNPFQE